MDLYGFLSHFVTEPTGFVLQNSDLDTTVYVSRRGDDFVLRNENGIITVVSESNRNPSFLGSWLLVKLNEHDDGVRVYAEYTNGTILSAAQLMVAVRRKIKAEIESLQANLKELDQALRESLLEVFDLEDDENVEDNYGIVDNS